MSFLYWLACKLHSFAILVSMIFLDVGAQISRFRRICGGGWVGLGRGYLRGLGTSEKLSELAPLAPQRGEHPPNPPTGGSRSAETD